MRHRRNITRVFLVAITAFSLSHQTAFGQTATSNQIADAATRAIAAIQRSQATWYDHQVCSSCHQQFQPAIAFAVAREHGISVDEAIARANAAKAFASATSTWRPTSRE